MATTTSGIQALYEDVVASLIFHYDNSVLLPGAGILTNVYNITGGLGNSVKVPITNSWNPGATVGEGAEIIDAAARDFNPGSITFSVAKRGAGTFVNEEALEDGGLATVRNAVLTRLSRSIAQATDLAGFNRLIVGSDDAPANIAVVTAGGLSNDGQGNVATYGGNSDVSIVMSPESLAYAMKREPTVKMWNDVDRDRYEMVATVRNGFARIPFNAPGGANAFFARAIIGSDSFDAANATAAEGAVSLNMISKAVANLRAVNAPTDATGFFLAMVTPAHEFQLARELNGVGAFASGSIGSVAQDLANQALLDALIGQAVGCRFIRSNNLPRGLADS